MEISRTALIIGATASLAYPLCHELAARGYALILAGRDEEELDLLAADLQLRHSSTARTLHADVLEPQFSPERLLEEAGAFDTLLWLAGDLGDETPEQLPQTIALNYTIPAQLLLLAGGRMEAAKRGSIVVVSSITGERTRGRHLVYGSAKAGLTAFASGLRNKLAKSGVQVLTVKPGPIDTPMTWGNSTRLLASRERVAGDIVRAMEKKREVIYTPWFWRWGMLGVRLLPEKIFKRMRY